MHLQLLACTWAGVHEIPLLDNRSKISCIKGTFQPPQQGLVGFNSWNTASSEYGKPNSWPRAASIFWQFHSSFLWVFNRLSLASFYSGFSPSIFHPLFLCKQNAKEKTLQNFSCHLAIHFLLINIKLSSSSSSRKNNTIFFLRMPSPPLPLLKSRLTFWLGLFFLSFSCATIFYAFHIHTSGFPGAWESRRGENNKI